jgi:protein-disulfide isomerase
MGARARSRVPSWARHFLVPGAAVLLASVLIGASQLSAHPSTGRSRAFAAPAQSARPDSLIARIPQQGGALGSPAAPVTLVEYADLQCPYCAEWARQALPVLIADYVRDGKLRIVFRGLAFIGPDSRLALRTAVAAGRQDRLWDVVHALYQEQGVENSGWVTDALLAKIAAGAGLEYDRLAVERNRPWVARRIATSAQLAAADGVRGTPAFAAGRTGAEMHAVPVRSLGPDGIVPAIEALLHDD